ncbi:hypothetical protein JRO89_XS13G0012800 [Xanthoceras sorbifolium]|uniref:Uncharacterized protein n=1 Tax=Xanthoceras sorbifolium TaxID=99658 RepID=A0ABQ8H5W3_9ROSI|nr:hypothetical protein JRO89_XS13G0012800 [Xanthoceras sorbifolium]
MYGGDEVSAIVLDLGSHTCKAGYAGEDAPKAVFPSVVGAFDQMDVDDSENAERNSGSGIDATNNVDSNKGKGKRKLYVGTQALGFHHDHMEVLSPLKDGVVADWDLVDSIWDHAFRECLLIDPKEHPMLLAEPSSNTQQQRESFYELKVKLSEKTSLLETAEGKIAELTAKVNEQQKLIQKLEDDISKGYGSKDRKGNLFDDWDLSKGGKAEVSENACTYSNARAGSCPLQCHRTDLPSATPMLHSALLEEASLICIVNRGGFVSSTTRNRPPAMSISLEDAGSLASVASGDKWYKLSATLSDCYVNLLLMSVYQFPLSSGNGKWEMNIAGFCVPGFVGNVPVEAIVSYYKIPLKQVLVIFDDLDLPFAKLRLPPKGGHGGHNGIFHSVAVFSVFLIMMRSIIDPFKGSRDFPRLRIGIGRPPGKMDAVNFVLRPFNKQEREEKNMFRLDFTFQHGIESVRILLLEGFDKSATFVNSTKSIEQLR